MPKSGKQGGGKTSSKKKSGKKDTGGGGTGGPPLRVVAKNRAATRRWEVEETMEAGLSLLGTEVKAMREGRAQLGDAYAVVRDAEIVLLNLHIGQYEAAGPHAAHDPTRPRKLLLRREEIDRLTGKLDRQGYSLIPLDLHFRGAWAKVQLGLCRGKRAPDRREDIKKREAEREVQRALRRR